MLDTIREVSTPELIELRLHCAGPVPRALAWVVDQLLRFAIMAVVGIVVAFWGRAGMAAYLIIFFVIEWFYPVLFEVFGHGATPGKRSLGLQVLHEDGTPIAWRASLIRNLLRAADFLPFLYGIGLISMLLSRDSRRLGDIVAGTLVVYRRPAPRAPKLPDAPLWRPRQPVGRNAQRAVLAYAERAPLLSLDRAGELAEYAPQLTEGARGETAVKRLYGLARLLTGRHA
jgi:uncharacterized RDD family membrane protein YckC